MLVEFCPSICFVEQKIWSYQWLLLRMGISKFCFLYLIIVLLSKKLGRVGLMSIVCVQCNKKGGLAISHVGIHSVFRLNGISVQASI